MENADASVIGSQIHFLCTSHVTQVPVVTMHEDRWAYCPGGYIAAKEGHNWTAIEPTNVTDLKPRHIGFVRAQELSRSA
jgi:hypothetical protein